MKPHRSHILVSGDPARLAHGAHQVLDALQDKWVAQGLLGDVQVLEALRLGGGASLVLGLIGYPETTHWVRRTVDDISEVASAPKSATSTRAIALKPPGKLASATRCRAEEPHENEA